MKPAPFKYIAAGSLEQAVALKAEYGDDAKFLAGGQSLIPAMNFRLARPAVLIDINALEEGSGLAPHKKGGTGIGALTPYPTLQNDISLVPPYPPFRHALPPIPHPHTPNP